MGHGRICAPDELSKKGKEIARRQMKKGRILFAALILLTTGLAQPAWAGMAGAVTLREIAKIRLQNLSFFIMVLLLSAALIRWIWNGLRKDFTRLPHLSY